MDEGKLPDNLRFLWGVRATFPNELVELFNHSLIGALAARMSHEQFSAAVITVSDYMAKRTRRRVK